MLIPACLSVMGGEVSQLSKLDKKKKDYLYAKLSYVGLLF